VAGRIWRLREENHKIIGTNGGIRGISLVRFVWEFLDLKT